MAFKDIFAGLVKPITDLASEFIEDKDRKLEFKYRATELLAESGDKLVQEQSSIIRAEIGGGSWLTCNWRPLVILTFAGLVVAHWLGFTGENVTGAEVELMLKIVQVAIGGYVVGRSLEKTADNWRKNNH